MYFKVNYDDFVEDVAVPNAYLDPTGSDFITPAQRAYIKKRQKEEAAERAATQNFLDELQELREFTDPKPAEPSYLGGGRKGGGGRPPRPSNRGGVTAATQRIIKQRHDLNETEHLTPGELMDFLENNPGSLNQHGSEDEDEVSEYGDEEAGYRQRAHTSRNSSRRGSVPLPASPKDELERLAQKWLKENPSQNPFIEGVVGTEDTLVPLKAISQRINSLVGQNAMLDKLTDDPALIAREASRFDKASEDNPKDPSRVRQAVEKVLNSVPGHEAAAQAGSIKEEVARRVLYLTCVKQDHDDEHGEHANGEGDGKSDMFARWKKRRDRRNSVQTEEEGKLSLLFFVSTLS